MQPEPLLHPIVERTFRQIILKDLANHGRPQWDKPHTEAVVMWMKQLLTTLNHGRPEDEQLNPKVLLTAAYAHDWGYAGLFHQDTPITIDQARSRKQLHMKRSATHIERLIYQRLSKYYQESDILRVYDLVATHDALHLLKREDELLLMEVDTLGMLDIEQVRPTLEPKENEYFMRTSIYEKRLPMFIHQQAQTIAQDLIQKRQNWYLKQG